jgi:hypothetical protein
MRASKIAVVGQANSPVLMRRTSDAADQRCGGRAMRRTSDAADQAASSGRRSRRHRRTEGPYSPIICRLTELSQRTVRPARTCSRLLAGPGVDSEGMPSFGSPQATRRSVREGRPRAGRRTAGMPGRVASRARSLRPQRSTSARCGPGRGRAGLAGRAPARASARRGWPVRPSGAGGGGCTRSGATAPRLPSAG